MKVFCNNNKSCNSTTCKHKNEHDDQGTFCREQMCATTDIFCKCLSIITLRKEKLEKIHENILKQKLSKKLNRL